MSTFLVVVWLVALVSFLLLPILFSARRRKIWAARIRQRQWRVTIEESNAAAAQTNEQYHFVVSRAQEDEIRESFLRDKLSRYTKSLEQTDVRSNDAAEDVVDDNIRNDGHLYGDAAVVDMTDVEVAVMSSDTATEKTTDDAETSDDASSDDEIAMIVEEYVGEDNSTVVVPTPGSAYSPDESDALQREVPNGCAICLSSFEVGAKVTWSSNPDCNHLFHDDCVLDWLMASGRKALRKQERHERRQGVVNYRGDPLKRITGFPMPCPCCRRDFVVVQHDEDDKEVATVDSSEASPEADGSLTPVPSASEDEPSDAQTPTESSPVTDLCV